VSNGAGQVPESRGEERRRTETDGISIVVQNQVTLLCPREGPVQLSPEVSHEKEVPKAKYLGLRDQKGWNQGGSVIPREDHPISADDREGEFECQCNT